MNFFKFFQITAVLVVWQIDHFIQKEKKKKEKTLIEKHCKNKNEEKYTQNLKRNVNNSVKIRQRIDKSLFLIIDNLEFICKRITLAHIC